MIDRSPYARQWSLDPEVVFLNHGSFGACPTAVLKHQLDLRAELERQPVAFLARRLPGLLDSAREVLATYLGAQPDDLVPVANATTGVNAVLRSLDFAPGDELLVTDHGYNACHNTLDFVATRSGARVVVTSIPFPCPSPSAVVAAILEGASERTRLALVDHVTSPTGMVLPVAEIVATLAERGIDTLVDGAHAPGMIALDLGALAPAYYIGNGHKWLCGPKGAAFLYVRSDRREGIHPAVISHGYNTRRPGRSAFHDEFDWVGTADPTPFLTLPKAIETMKQLLSGGWPAIRERNRRLALEGRAMIADALGVEPPCPDEMIGSLAALELPDGEGGPPTTALSTDPLQEALLDGFGIEVPVVPWPSPPRRLVRVSAQLYNSESDYEQLAAALLTLL